MIAVDTNVLARYLLNDDFEQANDKDGGQDRRFAAGNSTVTGTFPKTGTAGRNLCSEAHS